MRTKKKAMRKVDGDKRQDIWADYDPERVKEALAKTAGTWADLEVDALISYIHRAREEGTRPADKP